MENCRNASRPETAAVRSVEPPEPGEIAGEFDEGGTKSEAANEPKSEHALDAWADELRQSHLEHALTRLEENTELDEDQQAAIAASSRRLVDELLGGPRMRARMDGAPTGEDLLELFDVDPE